MAPPTTTLRRRARTSGFRSRNGQTTRTRDPDDRASGCRRSCGHELEQLVDAEEVPLGLDVGRRLEGVRLLLEARREERGEHDEDGQEDVPGDELVEEVVREEGPQRLVRRSRRSATRGSGRLGFASPSWWTSSEVDGEQGAERQRQHQDVDPEEPAHVSPGDVRAAAQQQQQRLADDRHAAGDLGAHDRRPVGALVPRAAGSR